MEYIACQLSWKILVSVFAGRLIERRQINTWFQFNIEVPHEWLFRHPPDFVYNPNKPLTVFIEQIMISCQCGDMEIGRDYALLIDTSDSYYAQNTFHVKNYDTVLPLNKMRLKKLKNLHSKQNLGKCRAYEYSSP